MLRTSLLSVLAIVSGCGGESVKPVEAEDTSWSGASVREQFPEKTASLECVTIWVLSGRGCAVADDERLKPVECATGTDPLILNAVPDQPGTCIIEIADCSVPCPG